MCCTSPPYWGLRSYGIGTENGELGLEKTPEEYVAAMVGVFREVRRVLADDGTLWLNLGSSYARDEGKGQHKPGDAGKQNYIIERGGGRAASQHAGGDGFKPKDMVPIPWMVAMALQADGWYLRSDIIWHKPNPMPESVTDRPTKAHEYVFLLSKRERYFYDAGAIREKQDEITRRAATFRNGGDYTNGNSFNNSAKKQKDSHGDGDDSTGRNARTVWTIPTQPTPDAHFATFPEALAERCILAGSAPGDVILDPFFGSGTVGKVAERLGRKWVGVELSPAYSEIAKRKTAQMGLLGGGLL
jgi:DNA modification methylase